MISLYDWNETNLFKVTENQGMTKNDNTENVQKYANAKLNNQPTWYDNSPQKNGLIIRKQKTLTTKEQYQAVIKKITKAPQIILKMFVNSITRFMYYTMLLHFLCKFVNKHLNKNVKETTEIVARKNKYLRKK
jgi:hypothetical protein